MNKRKRNELNDAITKLNDAADIIKEVSYDEEDYAENMPENLKASVKYDDARDRVDSLDEAITYINNAVESVMEAMQ